MHILKRIFIQQNLYIYLSGIVALFIFSHFYQSLFIIGRTLLILLVGIIVTDFILLSRFYKEIDAFRIIQDKLSIGDENKITIHIKNNASISFHLSIIDELPAQLQIRNFELSAWVRAGGEKSFVYKIYPKERGEYHFGEINIYLSTRIKLLSFRITFGQAEMAPVFPSIIQMRKFELYTMSDRLNDAGIKRIRRLGHTMEFDQIRKYIQGDDYRAINWKATARMSELMINQYEDEKSQPVYCAIDMGRIMRMPFEGMTLLDYAVNSSLVLANTAIRKQDKSGIITFSHKLNTLLPAKRKYGQMQAILNTLYNLHTDFMESSYEQLYAAVSKKIRQRSLIFLFTNFETISALKRQLPYLQGIARRHLLVVIFFKNTELDETINSKVKNTEGLYIQTIAEKFAFEKKQIIFELQQHGINNILTTPDNLSIDTINKYLEIKSRGMI